MWGQPYGRRWAGSRERGGCGGLTLLHGSTHPRRRVHRGEVRWTPPTTRAPRLANRLTGSAASRLLRGDAPQWWGSSLGLRPNHQTLNPRQKGRPQKQTGAAAQLGGWGVARCWEATFGQPGRTTSPAVAASPCPHTHSHMSPLHTPVRCSVKRGSWPLASRRKASTKAMAEARYSSSSTWQWGGEGGRMHHQ